MRGTCAGVYIIVCACILCAFYVHACVSVHVRGYIRVFVYMYVNARVVCVRKSSYIYVYVCLRVYARMRL